MLFGTFFRRSWLGSSLLLALLTLRLSAATVPQGFTESLVATGLTAPVTMQFAPDGRLFVVEQAGQVRVIENGTLLPTPFISLTVDNTGERGLLGIAFDPAFASEPWVYLYYTVPGVSGGPPHNRIVRVLASGNVASDKKEAVLDLDNLDNGQPPYHNGGAMAFGPDGYLYVGVGENMRPALAQDMTTRLGKLLRITRTGAIPADNPFYTTASGVNRAIWALGLRNPNNFSFNPGGSPAMLVNDVGQSRWEEINVGVAGSNYGWPHAEGADESGTPNPAFRYPIFSYFHSQGCAIIGSAFYTPDTLTFPAEYHGQYFFSDYCGVDVAPPNQNVPNGWISRIDPAAPLQPTQGGQGSFPHFADGLVAPVDIRIGNDGALYYLERPPGAPGAVYRLQYGSGAPGITSQPANQTVVASQQATFSVAANGSSLTYQWQRNRANITGATGATYAFATQAGDNGALFRVRVTNSGGTVTSSEALLTVSSNQAPVATITLPTAGITYGGGQTITYAGTGIDAEDGPLSAAAYTWRIDFHHGTHVHPFLPATSGTKGSTFVVPNIGHSETNVYFRVTLTVTDSGGATHSVFRDVVPRVVQLTLNTVPQGRQLFLDSQPVTAPLVIPSVEGVIRSLEAPNQTADGVSYTFTGWSDGGASQHGIVTPASNATYTASFAVPPTIATHPASQTAGDGQPVSFSVVASGVNLAYQWQRDQVDIVGATAPTYALVAQSGDHGRRFRVRVTNGTGTVTSNEALLTVTANQLPVGVITLPAAATTYGGGQTITYAATASDSEDGPLPAGAFTWRIDLHHDTHVHSVMPATSGITGGTFVVPTSGHTETNGYFRVRLTVVDSRGATHSVFRDVAPRLVQLTLNSEPQGRPLLLDSQPVTTPYVTPSVEGIIRTIEARSHVDGAVPYTFTGWSDGDAARHDIVTPAADATYTASFGTGAAAPTSFSLTANGATLTAEWNRADGAIGYRLEVGSAAGQSDLLNVDIGDLAFVQNIVPIGSYFARVRAIYPAGVSGASADATVQVTTPNACVSAPPPPGNYVARAGGLTAALSWLPASAATSYQLEVGSASGTADVLVADLGDITGFTSTQPAGNYFTRLRAVNACGASEASLESTLVLACAPDAVVPAGLTASATDGVATLAWDAPLGATGYRMLVGTAPGVALLDTEVGTATSVAVPLAGMPAGTYYVRVTATSACGVGLPSNEVMVTVP